MAKKRKTTRYISNANGVITIQRKRDFHEYRNITKSSRRRLNEILSHHNGMACKTSYGTIQYTLWSI